MGLTIEHECPQCGGPIELDETDHLITCPYCSINNFIYSPNYFRFILPHKAPDQKIFYAPYLRFKGNVYYCQDLTIGHRFLDITQIGIPLKELPPSLGLRPQAMKLKFAKPDTEGSFLKFSLKASDIVSRAAMLSSGSTDGQIYHRALIGETLSLIYLPLYISSNRIIDAILNRPITSLHSEHVMPALDAKTRMVEDISFIPTICPDCGWNLEGEADSIALMCTNCDTAWEVINGKFIKLDAWCMQGNDGETEYLPFWQIFASAKGIEINSFGDFMRKTNQPMVIKKSWSGREMSFWIPAFKIRPKIFLQLTKQMTISQARLRPDKMIPKKNLYPTILPRKEAAQAIKMTLANAAVSKKKILPVLGDIQFKLIKSRLVYLPFTDTGHDLVLQNMRISINRQALKFGRKL